MRLLDTKTQELKFFTESDATFGAKRPRYAILSHTWESDEVLFVDIVSQGQDWRQKAGAEKVLGSCQLAEKEGYGYIWIDTCCIDKSSSAELSEAINSMFQWYMKAEVCYVYLTDVPDDGSIGRCRWFKRGWTLQELIATTYVNFYNKEWRFIVDKISISSELARVTGIDESLLRCGHSFDPPLLKDHDMKSSIPGRCSCGKLGPVSRLSQLRSYCVAQKMSWASQRETTRDEDMAYCLMGLFEVNMPLLYAEGRSRAFFRLQREILENTHDQSILAIDFVPGVETRRALASRPNQFLNSGVVRFRSSLTGVSKENASYAMTTKLTKFGVNIDLLVVPEIRRPDSTEVTWFGILDCQMGQNPLGRPAIPLHPIEKSDNSSVFCIREDGLFKISPEHPHIARNLKILSGWQNLEMEIDLDRKVDMQSLRRQKITILQNFDGFESRTDADSLAVPIRYVSNSYGCQPYSVESQSGGRAILQTPGYPRLLIETFKDENITGYSSLMWMQDNSDDGRQLLVRFKDQQRECRFGIMIMDRFWPGSNMLVVPGPPDLKVEVKVTGVEFLDWITPEVTVTATLKCCSSAGSQIRDVPNGVG